MQGIPPAKIHYSDADYDDDDEDDFDWENDNEPCLIIPGLFIGSAEAEGNDAALSSKKISHVLTVAEGLVASHPDKRRYLQVHINDSPDEDIVIHLAKALPFIDEAVKLAEDHLGEGGVLVHCMMGISRSSSVCIAWLMSRRGMTFDAAFVLLKEKRSIVCPNSGFASQLKMWERQGCDLEKWRAWRLTHGPGEPILIKLS